MQIIISQDIADALKSLGHVPDGLRARIDGITRTDGGYALKLSDDDGIALAELVQWHMRTDPATGKPTPESAPFGRLIALIDDAQ
jgi:hypothetical protein